MGSGSADERVTDLDARARDLIADLRLRRFLSTEQENDLVKAIASALRAAVEEERQRHEPLITALASLLASVQRNAPPMLALAIIADSKVPVADARKALAGSPPLADAALLDQALGIYAILGEYSSDEGAYGHYVATSPSDALRQYREDPNGPDPIEGDETAARCFDEETKGLNADAMRAWLNGYFHGQDVMEAHLAKTKAVARAAEAKS